MNQQQLAQKAELGNGHVGTAGGLQTLHAADTDADVGSLDHGDIVCSVTDGEQNRLLLVFLDQLYHQGLLQRRHAAADDCLAHDGEVEEQLLEVLLQRIRQ